MKDREKDYLIASKQASKLSVSAMVALFLLSGRLPHVSIYGFINSSLVLHLLLFPFSLIITFLFLLHPADGLDPASCIQLVARTPRLPGDTVKNC